MWDVCALSVVSAASANETCSDFHYPQLSQWLFKISINSFRVPAQDGGTASLVHWQLIDSVTETVSSLSAVAIELVTGLGVLMSYSDK